MTETLCDSGAVKIKAGVDAPTAVIGNPTTMTQLINQAEGQLIADTRVNWIDVYSTLNPDFKQVIEGAVSAKAAVAVINYDPLSYGNLNTATTMINVLLDEYDRGVSKLKEDKVIKAFGGEMMTK